MSDQRVKEAFLEVREGRSAEYAICDDFLRERFLAAARRLGVSGTEADINTALINLRKENKLTDCPTEFRKPRDPNRSRYENVVSNTVRFLERQFNKNVDDIICDPDTRAQFDAMMQFLSPGISAFEARYTALSLRKSNQLKPEPVGQVIRAIESNILTLLNLEERLSEVPARRGVYIFFDEDTTLYAGKADILRSRIADHISTWTCRELIRLICEERRPPIFLVYHELPETTSSKDLTAYETELIRSRKPEHNRAGRVHKGG